MSGKSELKLFDKLSPQIVIQSAVFDDIHTKSSLNTDTNVIEFDVPASNIDYIDLNDTLLSLRCKITKSDGTALTSVGPRMPI